MTSKRRAVEPVIVLLSSSDEEPDEVGTAKHVPAKPEPARKGRGNGKQTPSKPRPSKKLATSNTQQKPPLRQQLTFTASRTTLSQPSPRAGSSPPSQQLPDQRQQQQPKQQPRKQQRQIPSQQQQQPVTLSDDDLGDGLGSSDDALRPSGRAPSSWRATAGSQQQDKKQSSLSQALVFQKPAPSAAKHPPSAKAKVVTQPTASQLLAQAPAVAPVGDADAGAAGLWSDKHAPRTSEDLRLSVHQKKVQQVRDWLEHQLPLNYRREYCRLMIITGPPGCCKSSVVRVLADELGFSIVEWTAPTPTMWSEYKYQASAGSDVPYTSKLDDFETFVSRAKYPTLSLCKTSASAAVARPATTKNSALQPATTLSSQPSAAHLSQSAGDNSQPQAPSTFGLGSGARHKLTLIDDVPYAADVDARKRLSAALQDLVNTSRSPVVLVATEGASSYSSGDNSASSGPKGLHKDILANLQDVGAMVTSFNPITAANIVKVLQSVAQKEQVQLSTAAAASIAATADGDLRNAVQTLQTLYGQKTAAMLEALQPTNKRRRGAGGTSKRAAAALQKAVNAAPLSQGELMSIAQAQRDQGLQLFHALGKILYNKRDQGSVDEEEETGWGPDGEVMYSASSQFAHSRGGGSSSGKSRGKSAATLAREEAAAKIKQERQRADAPGAWPAVVGEMCAAVQLPSSCQRPPMRYDPEALLVQSQLDALGAASFLQENYTSFIADDAIEDAAEAAAYLSDAAALATTRVVQSGQAGGFGGVNGLEEGAGVSSGGNGGVMQACAGSVATRGLLYANCHPAPWRFLSMRAPAMGQAARACSANEASLQGFARRMALQQGTVPAGGSTRMLAAQQLPQLRKLASAPSYRWLLRVMPAEWSYLWEGKVTVVQHDGSGSRAGAGRQGIATEQPAEVDGQTQALLSSFVEGLSLEPGSQDQHQAGGVTQDDDPIEGDA